MTRRPDVWSAERARAAGYSPILRAIEDENPARIPSERDVLQSDLGLVDSTIARMGLDGSQIKRIKVTKVAGGLAQVRIHFTGRDISSVCWGECLDNNTLDSIERQNQLGEILSDVLGVDFEPFLSHSENGRSQNGYHK
jgi:hypothetical protein